MGERLHRRRLAHLLALVVLAAAREAGAVDLALRAEPGVAGPLTDPQRKVFGVGGGAALTGALSLARFLDLQVGGGFLTFATSAGDPAMVVDVGAGARLKRPHGARSLCPWLDANALYVRSGALDRFGFTVGAGVDYPLGAERRVWLGAYARYLQVVQEPARAGFDNTDAKILIGGLSIEVGGSFHAGAGGHDLDGDGVPDTADRCPTLAGVRANGGCPDLDIDGDGVVDRLDQCPKRAGPPDNGGCPLPDRDGDGVADAHDRCPLVYGPDENEGCPWPDRDGDGVADADDRCPRDAGPKTTGGCPDRDGDEVADMDDVCPSVKGDRTNHGCPKYLYVTVTSQKLELSQKIFFSYDGDHVLDKSFGLLDEVSQALKDQPALQLRIEGHTDGYGRRDHNIRLSQRRANAVRAYLIDHGIGAERLEAKGYGPTQPLATNSTPDGRERNRRVEFVIVKGSVNPN